MPLNSFLEKIFKNPQTVSNFNTLIQLIKDSQQGAFNNTQSVLSSEPVFRNIGNIETPVSSYQPSQLDTQETNETHFPLIQETTAYTLEPNNSVSLNIPHEAPKVARPAVKTYNLGNIRELRRIIVLSEILSSPVSKRGRTR